MRDAHARRLEHLLADAATRGEQLMAWARLAIAVVALGRSLWLWLYLEPGRELHALVVASVSILLIAAAFSIAILTRCRRRSVPPWMLGSAAGLDVILASLALATNVWRPGPGYVGIPYMPDAAALGIVLMGSGLRLSVAASLVGGGLAFACFAGLVALDEQRGAWQLAAAAPNLTALGVVIAGAAFLSTVVAARTRTLARVAASRAIDAERAATGLSSLGRTQEDLRALLRSAASDAQQLRAAAFDARMETVSDRNERTFSAAVERLDSDIADVNTFLSHIDDASGLAGRGSESPSVDVLETVERARARLAPRFPAVRIEIDLPAATPVRLPVDPQGLEHALHNLIANACEGDGGRAAQSVRITMSPLSRVDEGVGVVVMDDGPGFPLPVLESYAVLESYGQESCSSRPTTKRGGSGLGLGVVRAFAESSGGALHLSNPGSGGAVAALELPAHSSGPCGEASRHRLTADAVLAQEATRAERAVAVARVVLGSLAFGRASWVWMSIGWGAGSPPARLVYVLGAVAALFSVYTFVRSRRTPLGTGFLVSSVALDIGFSAAAIGTNVLFIEPFYAGLHVLSDLSFLLLPVMGASLRLSVPGVVLAAPLGLLALAGLLALDQTLNSPGTVTLPHHVSMLVLLLLQVGGVGVLIVVRARRIVTSGARMAVELERSATRLAIVMRDHHDVRTLLSSASLNAGLALRALERQPERRSLLDRARRVRAQLERVNDCVSAVRERSYGELATLGHNGVR